MVLAMWIARTVYRLLKEFKSPHLEDNLCPALSF
jgi:hypothetical protein